MLDFFRSWTEKVALMEFAYNNSYHQFLEMSAYEALYGKKCWSPIHQQEASERKFFGPKEVGQGLRSD